MSEAEAEKSSKRKFGMLMTEICRNHPELVQHYLSDHTVDLDQLITDSNEYRKVFGTEYFPLAFTWESSTTGSKMSLLHLAVSNLARCTSDQDLTRAIDIFKLILSCGSELVLKEPAIGFFLPGPRIHLNGKTPIQLASDVHSKSKINDKERIYEVISMLSKEVELKVRKDKPREVTVLAGSLKGSKKLRQLSDFYDFDFVCTDGHIIKAHRNVLAAHSPYFADFFKTSWANVHEGKWRTEHNSTMINTLLDFMYLGQIDHAYFDKDHLAIYTIAMEFQMPCLKEVSGVFMMNNLTTSTVMKTIQLANLHNDTGLKDACLSYIQANCSMMLVEPSFAAFSLEDPVLWKDILTSKVFSPSKPGRVN
jgi:hypothetical protein